MMSFSSEENMRKVYIFVAQQRSPAAAERCHVIVQLLASLKACMAENVEACKVSRYN